MPECFFHPSSPVLTAGVVGSVGAEGARVTRGIKKTRNSRKKFFRSRDVRYAKPEEKYFSMRPVDTWPDEVAQESNEEEKQSVPRLVAVLAKLTPSRSTVLLPSPVAIRVAFEAAIVAYKVLSGTNFRLKSSE